MNTHQGRAENTVLFKVSEHAEGLKRHATHLKTLKKSEILQQKQLFCTSDGVQSLNRQITHPKTRNPTQEKSSRGYSRLWNNFKVSNMAKKAKGTGITLVKALKSSLLGVLPRFSRREKAENVKKDAKTCRWG